MYFNVTHEFAGHFRTSIVEAESAKDALQIYNGAAKLHNLYCKSAYSLSIIDYKSVQPYIFQTFSMFISGIRSSKELCLTTY